jgi:hypothetical protein
LHGYRCRNKYILHNISHKDVIAKKSLHLKIIVGKGRKCVNYGQLFKKCCTFENLKLNSGILRLLAGEESSAAAPSSSQQHQTERAAALEKTPQKQVGAEASEAHHELAVAGLVWPPNPLRLSQLVAAGKLPPWPEFLDSGSPWDVSTKNVYFIFLF